MFKVAESAFGEWAELQVQPGLNVSRLQWNPADSQQPPNFSLEQRQKGAALPPIQNQGIRKGTIFSNIEPKMVNF